VESMRLSPVVFCGENPAIVLVNAQTGKPSAAASYWHCTYSAYGEGHVLLVYLDAANAANLKQPSIAIYADNVSLGRYLTDTFNQHFDDWKELGFGGASIQQARFFKESDSREFYRVACHAEKTHIDLLWHDIHGCDFRTFPDLFGGGFGVAGDEHYSVANVIFLCGKGDITINQRRAAGEPQTRTLPDGRFSSSVFIALSETWIKLS
jgi:hypothetical protein